jgi:hypothetical protein
VLPECLRRSLAQLLARTPVVAAAPVYLEGALAVRCQEADSIQHLMVPSVPEFVMWIQNIVERQDRLLKSSDVPTVPRMRCHLAQKDGGYIRLSENPWVDLQKNDHVRRNDMA